MAQYSGFDFLADMAKRYMRPDDPERLFVEWLRNNKGRYREALAEMGVEEPAPGPDFINRLKAAVLAGLEKK